jgi:hypothetical protein
MDAFPNMGMLARTARYWQRQIAKMDAFSNIGMLKYRSPKWMLEHRCQNTVQELRMPPLGDVMFTK